MVSTNESLSEATFGAGCFWGVQHHFKQLKGVLSATSGYMGGAHKANYFLVSTGLSGHAEVVHIIFDPNIISYRELVDFFWRVHNPTQRNRQGPDIGSQYRSVIFYYDEEQKRIAEESKAAFDAKKVFEKEAVTQILPAKTFYPAEQHHQDYVEHHPGYVCHALRDE